MNSEFVINGFIKSITNIISDIWIVIILEVASVINDNELMIRDDKFQS